MNKTIFIFLSLILSGMFLSSCNKEEVEDAATIENYVNEAVTDLETRTRIGRGGCFELVFPVSIELPNGKIVEVESYEALKDAIRKWRKGHGKPVLPAVLRPHFVFPIDVITKEGETVTVDNIEELISLRKDCIASGGGIGKPCFRLNYPLSIVYPDGSTVPYNSLREMRLALREWRKNNNGDVTIRPVLSFPLSVTLSDGTVVTVNSKEELKKLKEDCK